MSLNATGILDAIVSHALTLGLFDRVSGSEPKNAPGNGLSAAFWVDRVEPIRGSAGSGLDSTSVRLTVNARIYVPFVAAPEDGIDPQILTATATLMDAYTGAFTLGGLVRCVDLLGAAGVPLSAQAGYLNQDSKIFRVMVVTIPLLVDNVWDQEN